LGPVEFDRDTRIGAQQVDFQLAPTIEGNRERDIETESAIGLGECLEPPKEERLRRAPGSVHAVAVLGEPASGVHEQTRQGRIHSVPDQPADTA
jgi:hypothetical protein